MERVATGFGLIEGPVWEPAKGLYFSDVPNGGVHLLDRSGKVTQVVPKRRGIGGMALHADGGLIVGGRDIALVSLKDGAIVWRGSFLEKGDGPYNDPNTAEVTERDATGNSTAKQAQLEPPSYREVLEKLANRVRGTLPKPPAKS